MINIDRVYQRVLFIANKEQRGYITPDEFNSFADQAQLEIFESYFIKKFQTNAAPGTMDDYSDIAANVDEKITFFDNTYQFTNEQRVDLGATNSSTNSPNYLGFLYPPNFYRLGLVHVAGPQGFPITADEVTHKDLTYVNLSPLTRPTATQPVFVRHEGGFRVFPLTIAGSDVEIIYVRRPIQPTWAHLADPNGVPLYNSAASQDFEIHPSDEQELVYKILTLSGVAIKAADIAQFGQAKDQQLTQTEG